MSILDHVINPNEFECPVCLRHFPTEYKVVNKNPAIGRKVYGTKTLMALWAAYNFKKHLIKCSRKGGE